MPTIRQSQQCLDMSVATCFAPNWSNIRECTGT